MADELIKFDSKPEAQYMIAGWRRQWSNGGSISGRLPRYLIEKLGAKRIASMGEEVSNLCYPFQVAGTHDSFRPVAAYQDGLPSDPMHRENYFYDAGNGLIIFLGEEPWSRIDLYGQAFFQAVKEMGIKQTVAVEGVNGPVPPDLERRVTCVYSKAEMKEDLEKYGLQFSSYGSESRRGPTIAMALVTLAHYHYPDVEMVRFGSMAPMYPFLASNNEPLGITRDHRSFYDIMRRVRSMFKLDIDLSELETLGMSESRDLQEKLERISSSNPEAKEVIDRVRADYKFTPFEEIVELDPALDKTLEDILRNIQE
ncbi:MAG: PAC2 family protein [Chloroflexi bacterium]|nr:PAC2 family protein [Chloroflexota bacterium]